MRKTHTHTHTHMKSESEGKDNAGLRDPRSVLNLLVCVSWLLHVTGIWRIKSSCGESRSWDLEKSRLPLMVTDWMSNPLCLNH